jgi:hypothetical protein
LYSTHPRWVIDTLFTCTALTLAEFAANPTWMGSARGAPAFSLVLHTWTQDLQRHIHVHAVMVCGVLDKDGQWAAPTRKPNFLFPVHALLVPRDSQVFVPFARHRRFFLEAVKCMRSRTWRFCSFLLLFLAS